MAIPFHAESPDPLPLVSVITSFFNVENYFTEAIESVVAQSYENWELILVDDGSTDRSPRIAQESAANYPSKIRCVTHEGRINKGISASRNLGISRAKGDLISFLDADDVWMENKLAHQVRIIERYPKLGMICGASLYWSTWNDPEATDRLVEVGCEPNRDYSPPELLKQLYPLKEGNAPSMNGVVVRKRAIDEVGGFADEFSGMYEDQVFLSKIYLSYPVYVSNEVFDWYRIRAGSVSDLSQQRQDYRIHRTRYLNWFRDYMRTTGVSDPEILALLDPRWPNAASIIGLGSKKS